MRRAWLAMVVLLCAGPAAGSSDYYYQSLLLGERAMALGGAYAALGAAPVSVWYNPAGLGFLKGTRFSAQTGIYGQVSDRTEAGTGFIPNDSGHFVSFASTAALARQVGGPRHKLGFAILTPDLDARSVTLHARNVTMPDGEGGTFSYDGLTLAQDSRDTTLWLGPAYAYRIHPRVALGASLFFAWRSREFTTKLLGHQGGMLTESTQIDVSLSHISLIAMLGLRAELLDGLFLGVTFRTPNLRLTGSADTVVRVINPGGDPRSTFAGTKAHYKLPWRASIGLAYVLRKLFAIAVDVTIHGGIDPHSMLESPELDPVVSEVAKKRVVNVNAGLEYYIAGVVPLRLGFFTNFSAQATPRPEVPVLLGLGGVVGGEGTMPDYYGVTGGIGIEEGRTTLSLSLNYLFASGTSVLGNVQGNRTLSRLMLGIGGSYAF